MAYVNTTFLPKTNGLVFADRLTARSNKGRVFLAANESVEYPPLALVTAPTLTGDAYVGATITGTQAVYSGGQPPVAVQSQIQVSDDGVGGWSGVDAWGTEASGTHYISPDQLDKYFRVAGRAIDESIDTVAQMETLMSFSNVLGPVTYEPAAVSIDQALPATYDVTPFVRHSLQTKASGLYDVSYIWQFRNAADTGWVNATMANLAAEYPDVEAVVFEVNQDAEPIASAFMFNFVAGPGPSQFRCRFRDTDPTGAFNQKTTTTQLNYV